LAVKSVLTTQTDFTGEFPVSENTLALWRFNEAAPDADIKLMDSSGHGRHILISGWSGTTASLPNGKLGRYFKQNINNPTSEKTYLQAVNDSNFFTALGDRIAVGGWINLSTYSVGQT